MSEWVMYVGAGGNARSPGCILGGSDELDLDAVDAVDTVDEED